MCIYIIYLVDYHAISTSNISRPRPAKVTRAVEEPGRPLDDVGPAAKLLGDDRVSNAELNPGKKYGKFHKKPTKWPEVPLFVA